MKKENESQETKATTQEGAASAVERLVMPGDYVLATKWNDGDPGDHWGVGFYDGSRDGRCFVVDNNGSQIRAGGFRRVGHITPEFGRWLLETAAKVLEASPPGTVNLWTMLTAIAVGGEEA